MSNEKNSNYSLSPDKAKLFLDTLKKSSKIAQDLINTNQEMSLRVLSLEAELANSRQQVSILNQEISQIRNGMTKIESKDSSLAKHFEEIVEEQNCLAHLFVTSDQLSQARSPKDAIRAAEEVLHNLIGALYYGIFLRWENESSPTLITPKNAENEKHLEPHLTLVGRCLESGRIQRPENNSEEDPPVCFPLMLESKVVGALLITELVHHNPQFERLQRDLVGLLSDRLAMSLCVGLCYKKLEEQQTTMLDLRAMIEQE